MAAMKKSMMRLLEADLDKAGARADAAKQQVRTAKATLKRARKLFKAEKKAAKQAKKKLEAARIASSTRPSKAAGLKPAPAATPKVKVPALKTRRAKTAIVKRAEI